jgi:hypothetical protein
MEAPAEPRAGIDRPRRYPASAVIRRIDLTSGKPVAGFIRRRERDSPGIRVTRTGRIENLSAREWCTESTSDVPQQRLYRLRRGGLRAFKKTVLAGGYADTDSASKDEFFGQKPILFGMDPCELNCG